MTRDRLPERRFSVTKKVNVTIDGAADHAMFLTIGFREDGRPAEVFCASFKKVGTALNSIVSDSCILLSRLMQHGDAPADLAATLCQPPSLVGQIAAVVAAIGSEMLREKLNG